MAINDSNKIASDTINISTIIRNFETQLSEYVNRFEDLKSIKIHNARFEIHDSSSVIIPNLLLNISKVDSGKILKNPVGSCNRSN